MLLTDKQQIIDVLSKYEFEMFNKMNDYKGELTTLNQKDIYDILYDMRNGVTVELDDNGMVIVQYPFNVCRLESRKELEDK